MVKVPHAAGCLPPQLEQVTVAEIVFEFSVEDPVGAVGYVGIPEFRKSDALFASRPEMNRKPVAPYGQSADTQRYGPAVQRHAQLHGLAIPKSLDADVERKVVTEVRRFFLPSMIRTEVVEVSAVCGEFPGFPVVRRVGVFTDVVRRVGVFTDDRELTLKRFPQDGPVLGVGRMGVVLRLRDRRQQQVACVVEQSIESPLLVVGYLCPREALRDAASAFGIGRVR
ncbi:hypothetical protein [Micromonospora sagamiensis]|uniref:hypothetical protein n=1 Tax=Micromonospora sagamiensis TaxID=47875 RepID=UPI0035E57AB4